MQAEVLTLPLASAFAGGDLGSGLGINAVAFLSQLVSFGIVFYIMWRWGFPAITGIIDKRQAAIREGVENAERAKQELMNANARADEILTEARRQAQETIERAAKAAQQEANRIQEEAQVRAEQVRQQQVASIQQEANRARAELSRMVVDLTIKAAGQVINKSVDSNDNRRLVEEFVSTADNTRNN
jgi:F-type H+-transporting ATPase subunit b